MPPAKKMPREEFEARTRLATEAVVGQDRRVEAAEVGSVLVPPPEGKVRYVIRLVPADIKGAKREDRDPFGRAFRRMYPTCLLFGIGHVVAEGVGRAVLEGPFSLVFHDEWGRRREAALPLELSNQLRRWDQGGPAPLVGQEFVFEV